MHEVKVEFKYQVNEEVTCRTTGREGKVIARKFKLTKTGEEVYTVQKSYSVLPKLSSRNTFKVFEEDLITFVDGIAF